MSHHPISSLPPHQWWIAWLHKYQCFSDHFVVFFNNCFFCYLSGNLNDLQTKEHVETNTTHPKINIELEPKNATHLEENIPFGSFWHKSIFRCFLQCYFSGGYFYHVYIYIHIYNTCGAHPSPRMLASWAPGCHEACVDLRIRIPTYTFAWKLAFWVGGKILIICSLYTCNVIYIYI